MAKNLITCQVRILIVTVLKGQNVTGRNCRESRITFLVNFKQIVAGRKSFENSKIKLPWEFKVSNAERVKKSV